MSGLISRRYQELTSSSSLMAKKRLAEGRTHVCSLHLSSEERTLVEESDAKQARKIRRRGLPLKTHLVCRAAGRRHVKRMPHLMAKPCFRITGGTSRDETLGSQSKLLGSETVPSRANPGLRCLHFPNLHCTAETLGRPNFGLSSFVSVLTHLSIWPSRSS